MELRAVQAAQPPQLGELVVSGCPGAGCHLGDLREIFPGIDPAALSEGGLEVALRALRRRSAVPVEKEQTHSLSPAQ
jgi:hypothetical protein